MMVSHAGDTAVSGVSLVGTLDVLLILLFSSMVSGGSVVVSQALGRKNPEEARAASKQLIYVATGIAVAVSTLVLVFRKPLLSLLFGSVEPAVMAHAESYFFFIALSFPCLALESACAALFRSMGNSLTSLLVSIMMNLLNVTGNAILIFGFEMGAAGAAIATLISRTVGAVVITLLLHNKKNVIYIEKLFSYRPDRKVIRSILHIGVPHGIENGMFQFGKLLTQALIATMPTAAIAANAVANTLANFQYTAGSAFQSTMVTVVGRCVGAEEKAQAKRYSRVILLLNYALLFLVIVFTVIFAKPLIAVYDLEASSADLAHQLILYHSACAILVWPIAFTLPSAFRAASDVRFPLVISMFSMWVFRVAGSYFFALETVSVFGLFSFSGLGMGVMGVWAAMTVDWAFRTTFFLIRFVSGKWLLHAKPKKAQKAE